MTNNYTENAVRHTRHTLWLADIMFGENLSEFRNFHVVKAETFAAIFNYNNVTIFNIREPGCDWKVMVVDNHCYAIAVAYWGTDCVSHPTPQGAQLQELL